ncbi:MAG: hypothetical protein LBU28_03735 [Spirochaetaceae bacterium]|jgi:hypothetical protein|nr:hypothetical protein [Spirochaetaceae bacterium]
MYKTIVALLGLGCLAAVLAGCFDPALADISQAEPVAGSEPFTLTVQVGEPDARSIAGPTANRIRDTGKGTRNYIQVIVLDSGGKVAAVSDYRDDGSGSGNLVIWGLNYGQSYRFLVLMGHWQRDFRQGAMPYRYYEDRLPTLLMSGMTTATPTAEASTILVEMYSLGVDTAFESGDRVIEPEVTAGKPERVVLPPGDWTVKWRFKGTGFLNLIKAANENAGAGTMGKVFTIKSPVGTAGAAPLAGTVRDASGMKGEKWEWALALDIGDYTGTSGREGWVNFNLEYLPFKEKDRSMADRMLPAWIIRNGINDAAQDTGTDFSIGADWRDGNANGNGAVAFTVAEKVNEIVLYKTLYVSSKGADTNEGTKDAPISTVQTALKKAAAAYAVSWPDKGKREREAHAAIIILDEVKVAEKLVIGEDHPPIFLSAAPGYPDPKGKLQATEAIGDGNTLLTVQNGARLTLDGGLILSGLIGTGRSVRGVRVDGAGVFTMNSGEISGSSASVGNGVYITTDGTFIINGGRVIGNSGGHGGGVALRNSGTFIMNGGEISGNFAYSSGGVHLEGGTSIMNGGKIYGNSTDTTAGGVSLSNGTGVYRDGGIFTMNGGAIFSNFASMSGGGVYLTKGSFIMKGGEISNNAAVGYSDASGGGVYVSGKASFIMKGGKVLGNRATALGGGVYLPDSTSSFTKESKGIIYGPNADDVLKNTAGRGGHAVGGFRRRDTTAGEGVTLDSALDDGWN